MMPVHIPHTVVCSRKRFHKASFLKPLRSSFRLEATSLDMGAGDMVCGLGFVETKSGIKIREEGVACTDGKSLQGKAVLRQRSTHLS